MSATIPPALLTLEEIARSVRFLHELSHARQVEVLAAIKAPPAAPVAAQAEAFGVAVG